MPTVLLVEGYRFFFFSNEGQEPPHVHVRKGGGVAKSAFQNPSTQKLRQIRAQPS